LLDREAVTSRQFTLTLFVPGFALIVGVLGRGLHALYVGNRETSYRMMRYRVLFQGGTIVALVFGMYLRPNSSVDPATGSGTVVDKRFFLDYSKEYTVLNKAPTAAATPLSGGTAAAVTAAKEELK
jgi:hypothetical protein